MIPISRRTIAIATSRWRSSGSDRKSRVAELLLRGARAGQLGEEGDQQRQRAVDVVQVDGDPTAEDEEAARAATWSTTVTWATRSAYQKPTVGRSRNQATPPQTPAVALAASRATPTAMCRPVTPRTLRVAYPPQGVGFSAL